jgi:hypothetical protein
VNLAWTVVIVMTVGWTLVSILVALAFGGMARGRDDPRRELVDAAGAIGITGAPGRSTPPMSDDEFRAAV